MKTMVGHVVGRVAALVAGVLWGFFAAFNVVFSDVFGFTEMAWAVVFVLAAYVILGGIFGAAGPGTGWRWMWWLAPPGVLFVALALFDNVARAIYHASVISAVIGGSLAGAALGVWIRERASTRGHQNEVSTVR